METVLGFEINLKGSEVLATLSTNAVGTKAVAESLALLDNDPAITVHRADKDTVYFVKAGRVVARAGNVMYSGKYVGKAFLTVYKEKPTEDQLVEEARQYALGRGIPLQSFEHLASFAIDNVCHFEDQTSQECIDMFIATIYTNIETFEAGEWYEAAYRFEGAEKFRKGGV